MDRRSGSNGNDALHGYIRRGGYATIREREVYNFCIVGGVSIAECSKLLGPTPHCIRTYLKRLRRRVRDPSHQRKHRHRLPRL
jgi:hypothetical protein